jgi:hypothetical protein
MKAAEQLQWARRLLDRPDAATAGVWPRAAALLARHALEQLLNEFWAVTSPPVMHANRRAQMIALRGYPIVREHIGVVRTAYAGLSSGCHHHPYELPPTRAELDGLIALVEGFAEVVGQATVQPKPPAKRR